MLFKRLFGEKEKFSPPPDRRTGRERRQAELTVPEDRRDGEERRSAVQESEKHRIIEKYKRIPLFANLSTDQILKLLRISTKQRYTTLQYIYRRETNPESLFIVLKGSLHCMLRIDEAWYAMDPYDCAGEIEFFTGAPRVADVIAAEEAILLRFSREEARQLFEQDKDLYAHLLRNAIASLSLKLIKDTEKIEQLHYRLRSLDTI